jgi:hypothetical protein
MLAILINRAKQYGKVSGLIPHLAEGEVSILQYTNDTIIFLKQDLEKFLSMRLILCIFSNFLPINKLLQERNFLFCSSKRVLEICPRVNNKVIIIYLYAYY